jgi:hypothetical protein
MDQLFLPHTQSNNGNFNLNSRFPTPCASYQ